VTRGERVTETDAVPSLPPPLGDPVRIVLGAIVSFVDDYSHAVVTALLGAVARAIGSLTPPTGSAVAPVAWAAALVVIAVLNGVLGLGISAFGVPAV